MMNHKITCDKAIENWDEALPLGNGRIGALIWGKTSALRFSIDRTDIWETSNPLNTDLKEFTYSHMVKLAKEGNTDEIRRIFDAPYNYPTPTKLPAGKIIMQFKGDYELKSELHLRKAEATLSVNQGEYEVRAFCHAMTRSGVIQVKGNSCGFTIKLENPQFGNENPEEIEYDPNHRTISQGGLERIHVPAPKLCEEKGTPLFRWFEQQIDESFAFGIVMGIIQTNEETLVVYRVVTSKDSADWVADAKNQIAKELMQGYEKSFRSHYDWWKSYWKKSSIKLPDKFFEKQWYISNYLFASCSRKGEFPMPLQGVWSADNGELPPWKGDYHNDLNTQLCYSHFFKANHLEEGSSFIDFLWNSMDVAKEFAKKFYGTEGICLPGVMTIDGKPLGGWPMYSLSPTHQIWLCQSFELYFQYTGDMKFLREKAWVYFEETAKCMTALLEEREGYYYLQVSSSPEIHDDEKESWLTPNSNYDLALLRYLYQTLIRFAGILGNGQENVWKKVLDKLPPLAVNEKNVLMLSPNESLKESHRHLSNAMAICPLRLMDYKTEKEIIDATVLDYEFLGTGMWVGFSFAWMSHLYSIQGNGEGAYEQLRIFWESFCSSNGFHLNGDFKKRGYTTFHYRPFTLEANMYAADALQEMLFQMHDGEIEVFAAIPKVWKEKEISFENFRGENGILVSAKWTPKQGTEIVLVSEKEQEVCIKINKYKKEKICLRSGEITHILLEQYM